MNWKALVPPRLDHRVRFLPVAVLNVISTCDSRCVACDYWRQTEGPRLARTDIDRLIPELERLGTRQVLLSGGEPLVHPDLPKMAERLHGAGFEVLLHTNAVRLGERLDEIGRYVSHLFVSLDGASPETYRRMRGVDAFDLVVAGIREARKRFPALGIGSRTVLMRGNLEELEPIVELGLREGLKPLSFLGADVESNAFGRTSSNPGLARRVPSRDELDVLARTIRGLADAHATRGDAAIEGGYRSLWRIHARYVELANGRLPIAPRCNAPWSSAVIEPDGAVRPCFFHPAYGKLSSAGDSLEATLNSSQALDFRRGLDVSRNPICRHCVCWKHQGFRETLRAAVP